MAFDDVVDKIKEKPILLAIPAGIAIVLMMRGRGNAPQTTPSTVGQMPSAANVSTSMLANAMQDIRTEQQDFFAGLQTGQTKMQQEWNTDLLGVQQSTSAAMAEMNASIQQSSIGYGKAIQDLQKNLNKQIQDNLGGMNMQATNALHARQQIGDNAIINYFAQFKLPSWIGLQYVAENKSLPSGIPQLQAWLNSHGYRDSATGAYTPIVGSDKVPQNVQQELNAAYG